MRIGQNVDIFSNDVCGSSVTLEQALESLGSWIRVDCSPPVSGRYVSVDKNGYGALTLCEILVEEHTTDICNQPQGEPFLWLFSGEQSLRKYESTIPSTISYRVALTSHCHMHVIHSKLTRLFPKETQKCERFNERWKDFCWNYNSVVFCSGAHARNRS